MCRGEGVTKTAPNVRARQAQASGSECERGRCKTMRQTAVSDVAGPDHAHADPENASPSPLYHIEPFLSLTNGSTALVTSPG
jgi:hypothetical protein